MRISEKGRIVLFAVSAVFYFSLDSTIRSVFFSYMENVRQSIRFENLVLGVGVLGGSLCLLLLVSYMAECVVLYASLRTCTPNRWSFAETRLLVAIGSWIVTIPASVAYLLGSSISHVRLPAFDSADLPAWFAEAVGAPYVVLLVSEAAGISLARSIVVLLIALVGCHVADVGLDLGLERLNEFLLGFVPDKEFV